MGKVTMSGIVPLTGTPLSEFAVGSVVKMNVNSVAKDFIVVHQGKPSSIYSTTFDNGTILLMKDIYESRRWDSSDVNNYENSTIHSYLNNGFLGLFDANIQSVIKQVKIPYRQGSGTNQVVTSGENGLSCKIFLLSCEEVGFTSSDAPFLPINEGAKLNYFESGTGTSAKNKRIAKLNGSDTTWWLRSPYCRNSKKVYTVIYSGEADNSFPSSPMGVRPALVLPSDTTVDDTGRVVA